MTGYRQTLLVLLLTILSGVAVAQNNTNSPYTRYGYGPVSYTHLDVYKRQVFGFVLWSKSTLLAEYSKAGTNKKCDNVAGEKVRG